MIGKLVPPAGEYDAFRRARPPSGSPFGLATWLSPLPAPGRRTRTTSMRAPAVHRQRRPGLRRRCAEPPRRNHYSSHSVLKLGLTWMSICLSTPSPVFLKACGTPGGTITSSPRPTSSVSSPSVNVPLPSWTSSSSSYGCVCSDGPRPGGASTMITHTPTPPWSAPTNSCAMLENGRSATFRTGMAGHLVVGRRQVAFDQVAVVLGIEDRGLVVLAGERLDGVQRVPQREGHELGQLADVAAQHPGAAVSGRGDVGGDPGLVDVGGIGVTVFALDGAPPGSCDHAASVCTSSAFDDQPPSNARTSPSPTNAIRSAMRSRK